MQLRKYSEYQLSKFTIYTDEIMEINMGLYLWVANELPVKFCIKRLHMQAIHTQHWITNNTDL